MMQRDDILNRLLEALEKKIPEKSKLVDTLMEILYMEKGAINRRLRGDVPFSFYEVANIADKLELSIVNLNDAKTKWVDSFALDTTGVDFKKWHEYIALVNLAKKDPLSEFASSTNHVPGSIYAKYESLYKFFIYKYVYLIGGTENRTSFKEFIISEELKNIYRSYYHESKFFAKNIFICDHAMVDNLITDLRYFSGINLLSGDDMQQIKEELFAFLNYFEEIAVNGCFDETGTQVDIYISDVNLDSNYNYMKINDICISLVRTFNINAVMGRDKTSYERIKNWIQSLKRTSTLISRSAAVFRAEFFEKQRALISGLNTENSR